MRKLFLAISFLVILAVIAPTAAQARNRVLDFLAKIFLDTQEEQPIENFEMGEEPENFVDPRELQQVLKELKDIKRELNKFAKQLKKTANNTDTLNQISSLLEQAAGFEAGVNSGENVRDAIQEFRDAQIWDEINIIRAKIEIPRETAQWNKEIKRIEKMLSQKKYQGLGLDLDKVREKFAEIKAGLANVQQYYAEGDFESALEELNSIRQDFNIADIGNVIQRTQELTNKFKTIKDAAVKNQIKEIFAGVLADFNEGEYRVARDIMDGTFNEVASVIAKAYSIGKKKGITKEAFSQMASQLGEKLRTKLEEKKAEKEEMELRQFQPMQQPVQQQPIKQQMQQIQQPLQQQMQQPVQFQPQIQVQPQEQPIQPQPQEQPLQPQPIQNPPTGSGEAGGSGTIVPQTTSSAVSQ